MVSARTWSLVDIATSKLDAQLAGWWYITRTTSSWSTTSANDSERDEAEDWLEDIVEAIKDADEQIEEEDDDDEQEELEDDLRDAQMSFLDLLEDFLMATMMM